MVWYTEEAVRTASETKGAAPGTKEVAQAYVAGTQSKDLVASMMF